MTTSPPHTAPTPTTGAINEYSAYTEAAIARAFLATGLCEDDANHHAAAALGGEAIGGVATAVPHPVS